VLRIQTSFLEERYGIDPLITQIEKTDLDEFVDSWTGALSTRRADRENVRQFWLYCFDSDFTAKNIASRLKKLGTKRDEEELRNRPIPIFRPDEVAAFDAALDRCNDIFRREGEQDPDAPAKTRAFMYVIKFTGLSIVDVVTLRPTDIDSPAAASTSISINKQREKTKKLAHTGVPRFVWAMLQELRPESEFFFWSGIGNPASRVDTFRDRMKKLFVAAGIRVRVHLLRRNRAWCCLCYGDGPSSVEPTLRAPAVGFPACNRLPHSRAAPRNGVSFLWPGTTRAVGETPTRVLFSMPVLVGP
jgi:integrase